MSDFFSGLARVLPFAYGALGEAFTKAAGDPSAYAPPPPPKPPVDPEAMYPFVGNDDRLPAGWIDFGDVQGSLSQEPDRPIAIGTESPWYAARARSALEVVAKMELEIFGQANWETGLAASRENDFIFVTPPVRGYVYAVGRGCTHDAEAFATMGARFADFMRFDPQKIAWAKCEGGSVRSVAFAGIDGTVESSGEPTQAEVALGLDRCGQPGFDVRGFLIAQLSGRQDAIGSLIKAWGIDPSFADVDVEPDCGLVCRPAKLGSRRNLEDQLTIARCTRWDDKTAADPAEVERVTSFFLPLIDPHIDDPFYAEFLKYPAQPPTGWADTHSPDDDSYLEAYAHIDEWTGDWREIGLPHGQRIFDAIYEASLASGWIVRASPNIYLAFDDEQVETLRRARSGNDNENENTYLWIDSAQALRAFHGDHEIDPASTSGEAQIPVAESPASHADFVPQWLVELPVINEVLTPEQMDAWLAAQYAGTFTRRGYTEIENCEISDGHDESPRVGLCRVFDYIDSDGIEFTAMSRLVNRKIRLDSQRISRLLEDDSRLRQARGESAGVLNATDYAGRWAYAPRQRETLARIVAGAYRITYRSSHLPPHEDYGRFETEVVFRGAWADLDRLAEVAAQIAAEYGNPANDGSTAASVGRSEWQGVPEVMLTCQTDSWSHYPLGTVRSRFANRPSERVLDAQGYLFELRVRYAESREKFWPPHLHATDDVPAEWFAAYRAEQRARERQGWRQA